MHVHQELSDMGNLNNYDVRVNDLLAALSAASGRSLQWTSEMRCDLALGNMPFCIQILMEDGGVVVFNAIVGNVDGEKARDALAWNFSWHLVQENSIAWDAENERLHLVRFRRLDAYTPALFPSEVLDFLECAVDLAKRVVSLETSLQSSEEVQSAVTRGV